MRFNEIGRYYRRNATVRGLTWELPNEALEKIITNPCRYCNTAGHLGFDFTGIDRVDNTVGYVADNCVPCCKRCNQARNDQTVGDFLAWINRVYQHTQTMEFA